jgi:hypothetical protein
MSDFLQTRRPEIKLAHFPKQDHVCVRLQEEIQFGIEEIKKEQKV